MNILKSITLLSLCWVIFSFKSDELEKRSLLNGKLEMLMPSDFDTLSQEMLEAKYPSSRRPTLVYGNEDGTINLAINHLPNPITDEQLPQVLPVFEQQFNQLYPDIEWYRKETVKINDKTFIALEFVTPAVDTFIYNHMLITQLEGTMLMCSFNCTKPQEDEWKPIAQEMMSSIAIN